MLSGEFRHTLDPKNRLFIPAKHREELGESFMVVRSIRNNCLQVYSMEEWSKYIAPIDKMDRKDSERIFRALHRNATQATPDSQGRIVIPVSLLQHAEIVKGAVVVGCGAYAEIWAEEVYDKTLEDENLDDIKSVLESFGL
ncbi:MAG: division/cell wall cluster transcriptional repressor MraZ [Clostridia bacterium]|nr:division/cell wall cluster transcriptional repressor MraZ [Clostridia bacterium]